MEDVPLNNYCLHKDGCPDLEKKKKKNGKEKDVVEEWMDWEESKKGEDDAIW